MAWSGRPGAPALFSGEPLVDLTSSPTHPCLGKNGVKSIFFIDAPEPSENQTEFQLGAECWIMTRWRYHLTLKTISKKRRVKEVEKKPKNRKHEAEGAHQHYYIPRMGWGDQMRCQSSREIFWLVNLIPGFLVFVKKKKCRCLEDYFLKCWLFRILRQRQIRVTGSPVIYGCDVAEDHLSYILHERRTLTSGLRIPRMEKWSAYLYASSSLTAICLAYRYGSLS